MWYLYTMEYYSAIKNEILSLQQHYHTKWDKSEKERQIPCNIDYMWNIKYDRGEHMYAADLQM